MDAVEGEGGVMVKYVVFAYDYLEMEKKPIFLAERPDPDAALRCVEEFKPRWEYPYWLVIEEVMK